MYIYMCIFIYVHKHTHNQGLLLQGLFPFYGLILLIPKKQDYASDDSDNTYTTAEMNTLQYTATHTLQKIAIY